MGPDSEVIRSRGSGGAARADAGDQERGFLYEIILTWEIFFEGFTVK